MQEQPDDYVPRIVDHELDELLSALPALLLEGPKAVGKTATARRRAGTEFRLDDPAQLAIISAEPQRITSARSPVLVDEWQRLPAVWDVIRRAVDENPTPGSFILTGSAGPDNAPTHSGAGRIVSIRMRPLSLAERSLEVATVSLQTLLVGGRPPIRGQTTIGLERYVDEILRSGFPGLRAYRGRALRAQLDGYVSRIVDADIRELGVSIRKPDAVRRWLMAYAAATATTAKFETIRDAATAGQHDKPARSATQPWREALERLWVLDPVPAWLPTQSDLNRLAQTPKHHLADPALATSILGIDADALLAGQESPLLPPIGGGSGVLLGRLFESLVTQSLKVYCQAAEARLHHLRTHRGEREVDLIIERRDRRIIAAEVKLGRTVNDDDVRHLVWLKEQLGEAVLDSMVINTGSEAYRRADGIAVVPAALLGP